MPQDDHEHCFQISARRPTGESDDFLFRAMNEQHLDIWLHFLSGMTGTHLVDATIKPDEGFSRKPFSSYAGDKSRKPVLQPSKAAGPALETQQKQVSVSDRMFSKPKQSKPHTTFSLPVQQTPVASLADEISPVPNKRPAFSLVPTAKPSPPVTVASTDSSNRSSALVPVSGTGKTEVSSAKESVVLSQLLVDSIQERGRLEALVEQFSSGKPAADVQGGAGQSTRLRGMTIELQRLVDQLVETKAELAKEIKKRRNNLSTILLLSN